jgi:hypothetical protein
MLANATPPPAWRFEDASSCVREWLCPLRISEMPAKSNEFLRARRAERERVHEWS